ncbi:hypothetical protein Pelo_492 [Pelomyxa schiedti]|nr:hypothetical protein Pelo_492 [Pelomyxa schiedti]
MVSGSNSRKQASGINDKEEILFPTLSDDNFSASESDNPSWTSDTDLITNRRQIHKRIPKQPYTNQPFQPTHLPFFNDNSGDGSNVATNPGDMTDDSVDGFSYDSDYYSDTTDTDTKNYHDSSLSDSSILPRHSALQSRAGFRSPTSFNAPRLAPQWSRNETDNSTMAEDAYPFFLPAGMLDDEESQNKHPKDLNAFLNPANSSRDRSTDNPKNLTVNPGTRGDQQPALNNPHLVAPGDSSRPSSAPSKALLHHALSSSNPSITPSPNVLVVHKYHKQSGSSPTSALQPLVPVSTNSPSRSISLNKPPTTRSLADIQTLSRIQLMVELLQSELSKPCTPPASISPPHTGPPSSPPRNRQISSPVNTPKSITVSTNLASSPPKSRQISIQTTKTGESSASVLPLQLQPKKSHVTNAPTTQPAQEKGKQVAVCVPDLSEETKVGPKETQEDIHSTSATVPNPETSKSSEDHQPPKSSEEIRNPQHLNITITKQTPTSVIVTSKRKTPSPVRITYRTGPLSPNPPVIPDLSIIKPTAQIKEPDQPAPVTINRQPSPNVENPPASTPILDLPPVSVKEVPPSTSPITADPAPALIPPVSPPSTLEDNGTQTPQTIPATPEPTTPPAPLRTPPIKIPKQKKPKKPSPRREVTVATVAATADTEPVPQSIELIDAASATNPTLPLPSPVQPAGLPSEAEPSNIASTVTVENTVPENPPKNTATSQTSPPEVKEVESSKIPEPHKSPAQEEQQKEQSPRETPILPDQQQLNNSIQEKQEETQEKQEEPELEQPPTIQEKQEKQEPEQLPLEQHQQQDTSEPEKPTEKHHKKHSRPKTNHQHQQQPQHPHTATATTTTLTTTSTTASHINTSNSNSNDNTGNSNGNSNGTTGSSNNNNNVVGSIIVVIVACVAGCLGVTLGPLVPTYLAIMGLGTLVVACSVVLLLVYCRHHPSSHHHTSNSQQQTTANNNPTQTEKPHHGT